MTHVALAPALAFGLLLSSVFSAEETADPVREWAQGKLALYKSLVQSGKLQESQLGRWRAAVESESVEISLRSNVISPTEVIYRDRYHDQVPEKREALVLPIRITNKSDKVVRAYIPHEWYGGIWAPTDFHALVQPRGSTGQYTPHPVYCVGYDLYYRETEIEPHESVDLDLRMDWPGTGSCPTSPLMDPKKDAVYTVQFFLLFEVGRQNAFAISKSREVTVKTAAVQKPPQKSEAKE